MYAIEQRKRERDRERQRERERERKEEGTRDKREKRGEIESQEHIYRDRYLHTLQV